jgi:hypothetical protein
VTWQVIRPGRRLWVAMSSAYGFLAGTWPFGVIEAIWAVTAVRRYRVGSPVSRFAKPT